MSIKTFYASPRRVTRFLFLIATGLTIASFTASCVKHILGFNISGLSRLEVGTDSSLPTWYASFALLICALLLALITGVKKKTGDTYTYYWLFLSALFFYISIDEVATFRETFFRALRPFINTDGVFFYRWTLFAIPFVIIFTLTYLKFLASLPKDTKRLFFAAGFVFVLGAVGIEMLAALTHSAYGSSANMLYAAVTTFEEYFEMLGVIIFIYALLSYLIKQNIKGIQIRMEKD